MSEEPGGPVGPGTPAPVRVDAASARARRRATWLLIALRTAYAYNWFDIGPALPGIGADFAVGPEAWGLLVGGFLIGAGALQVPAGYLSRRYGARRVALAGAALLAVGGFGTALAPSFAVMLATRILAGAGAGLFFSPAIGLVGALYPEGERGVPVGIFSSAFSAGAAFGIFATALAIPLVGWREAIGLGAVGLAVLAALALAAIPSGLGAAPDRAPGGAGGGRPVAVRLRSVWAIGLAFVGFEGATFASGQFVVPFGEAVRGWSAAVAGAVGTAFVLPSVLGGPIGGVAAERAARPRLQLALVTAAGAGVLLVLPFAGLAEAVLLGATFSFAYGFVYAVMYVLPHQWPELPPGEIPLAIGLFNAIQLGGGALVSLAFGLVVAGRGYAVAWPFVGALQLLTLVALFALPPQRGGGRPPAAGRGPG